jgi:hypothetical protein
MQIDGTYGPGRAAIRAAVGKNPAFPGSILDHKEFKESRGVGLPLMVFALFVFFAVNKPECGTKRPIRRVIPVS